MNPILLPVGVRFIFQERKENIATERDNLTKLCQSKAAFNGLFPSFDVTTLNFNSVLCPLSRLKYKKKTRPQQYVIRQLLSSSSVTPRASEA
jgi:hypothetical protein